MDFYRDSSFEGVNIIREQGANDEDEPVIINKKQLGKERWSKLF